MTIVCSIDSCYFCTDKISKNELKRRMKAEQKAKEKAEKNAAQLKGVVKHKPESSAQEREVDEEEMDAGEFFKLRMMAVAQMKLQGEHPYPHKFHVDISLQNFIDKYNHLEPGQVCNLL